MKANTLLQAKKQLHLLYDTILPIMEHWECNKYTMLKTLLQNLAFDSTGTYGYEHSKEVSKCQHLIKCIEGLAKYEENCHVTGFVKDEVTNIWGGLLMCEEYE